MSHIDETVNFAQQMQAQQQALVEFASGLTQSLRPLAADITGFAGVAVPSPVSLPPVRAGRADLASDFYERLAQWIADFQLGLDEDTEVGVRLVSFGQAMTFHLADIGYWNPALISFHGLTERGEPVQLIQHVSQISVLLMRVPKLGDEPRRIGFHADGRDEPSRE